MLMGEGVSSLLRTKTGARMEEHSEGTTLGGNNKVGTPGETREGAASSTSSGLRERGGRDKTTKPPDGLATTTTPVVESSDTPSPDPMQVFAGKLRSLFVLREFLAMSVPALIYLVQNKLIFISFGMLPGPMFQVIYQMKILSAALLAKLFLGKEFSTQKWLCLCALTVGVCIVQVDGTFFFIFLQSRSSGIISSHSLSPHRSSTPPSVTGQALLSSLSEEARSSVDLVTGFACAMAAVFCSGCAGIYFEAVLKGGKVDLWVRNVHLSVVSIIIGIVGFSWGRSDLAKQLYQLASSTSSKNAENQQQSPSSSSNVDVQTLLTLLVTTLASKSPLESIFDIFGSIFDSTHFVITGMADLEIGAAFVLFLHAYGGLLVSLVVKYTDSVIKAFAASLAIVFGTVVSWVLFSDFVLSKGFVVGAVLVTGSVYRYSTVA